MKFLINLPKYQLYLLQLENYELLRYWRLLFKKGLWPKGEQRKQLVWTAKAFAVFLLAEVLNLTVFVGLVLSLKTSLGMLLALLVGFLVFCGLKCFSFICLTVVVIVLLPLDFLLKTVLVFRARQKLRRLSDIKVIGIAGSYGKTTMKEVLVQVLGAKLKVLGTPESVNTPVGIARWILKKLDASTEAVVIEMGEHYRGDVEEICHLAKPDIAVVTGINEAHLERMKTLENITDTIFEIVSKSKPGALVLLNADDARVMENYKKYVWPDHRVVNFKIQDLSDSNFNTEMLQWEARSPEIGEVKIKLLGEYALGDVSAAARVAGSLGLSAEEIKKGVEKIQPIEHRLQPILSSAGVLVIDDAYNGNPAGVTEAMKVLSRFSLRRKIFITPGLVETGKEAVQVHRQIGRELAGAADLVILVKNSVTPFIEEGIRQQAAGNRANPEVVWFDTAQAAHENLKNILKPQDVILFQNDWGDQYL